MRGSAGKATDWAIIVALSLAETAASAQMLHTCSVFCEGLIQFVGADAVGPAFCLDVSILAGAVCMLVFA